jgi:hypothetical protein
MRVAALLATALTLAPGAARAVDLDAGDLVAAPEGATVGLVYYQHAQRSKLYAKGTQALDDAQLNSDVSILRGVHYLKVAGVVAAPQVLLPGGSLRTGGVLGSDRASGIGDPILAMPTWFVNDAGAGRYVALVPYLWIPVGQYDAAKGALNLGENRWKGALQAGASTRFLEVLAVDAIADVTFFGANTRFGPLHQTRKQDPQYELQGYLSYLWSSTARLALGVAYTGGGANTVDGISQSDAAGTLKAGLTASFFIDGKNQLLFTGGRDVAVRNGLAEDFRFNFRLLHIF